ncbi:MAG TPA: hypothetical protein VEF76_11405 [Patescibacteria group bacterium]|nr:hypothetical protein [Patescibacteria group bacterium]
MSADKLHTDALKSWLDSLGQNEPSHIDSVLPQGQGVDWRETVLRSLFKPAASSTRANTASNDAPTPVIKPPKPGA